MNYADRWRRDDQGRRLLTLRMIRVRVKHLPPQSALGQVLNLDTGWTVGDYLLADVFRALTGKGHPARPKPTKKGRAQPSRQRAEKLAGARRRAAERRAAIERGEL